MNEAAAPPTDDIGTVEDRFFTLRDFSLANGTVMPEATLAYETYGKLAPHGRNAVLITHGYTGSHHAAGRNPANGGQPGTWDGLIGPGKPIDTDRLFVVASNMLGSSYGSTNAASRNPATGRPYGPDFPAIAIRDIVAAQKALLASLGVAHLVAVAGPSYGGYQAFQWAVAYPTSWMGSCRSIPRRGPRPIPTSSWPRWRRGSRPTPNGMAGIITAAANARAC